LTTETSNIVICYEGPIQSGNETTPLFSIIVDETSFDVKEKAIKSDYAIGQLFWQLWQFWQLSIIFILPVVFSAGHTRVTSHKFRKTFHACYVTDVIFHVRAKTISYSRKL